MATTSRTTRLCWASKAALTTATDTATTMLLEPPCCNCQNRRCHLPQTIVPTKCHQTLRNKACSAMATDNYS
eukprot:12882893-Prorocentrum_lima.AAC.1